MRIDEGAITLSATDLSNHLGCRHLTSLDAAVARGDIRPPRGRDPALDVLWRRGAAHEAAFVASLRRDGLRVVGVGESAGLADFDNTVAAMRSGADVIVQAPLKLGVWRGRADILRRVPGASAFGNWSYEVTDAKLARRTRAGTILQLCLYTSMLEAIQESSPEWMHVVSPGDEFHTERYRVCHYLAYFRLVQARLFRSVGSGAGTTYPEPVPQCDICRWWSACEDRRRDDDHLSLVAGISTQQRGEINSWGVASLAALAHVPLPLDRRPRRGHVDSYVRVREQARVQLEGRQQKAPVHELLPREPGRGLSRLPAPSSGDIFFDVEGDPFVGSGGLEYLLGWVVIDEAGRPRYEHLWAGNAAEERSAFEVFIDAVMQRWHQYPDLHIYHFAPYEPSAVKRLMGRYATREEQVDRILRAELFVDLYTVTRHSLRASVERYSIKDLERFYGYGRDVSLRHASQNLRKLENALELGQLADLSDGVRDVVRQYNRDDCVSMVHLRRWLEQHRTGLIDAGEHLPRPDPADSEPSAEVDERQQRVDALMGRLLDGVPEEATDRSEEQQARWLLAHLLDWHRREAKVAWWEFYRLQKLDEQALLDEDLALSGLQFVEDTGEGKRTPVHRYLFPPQETKLRRGDNLFVTAGSPAGSVHAIDIARCTLDIKKPMKMAAIHPAAVFTREVVTAPKQADALFQLGEWVEKHGADGAGPHRAARDLLLRRPPRQGGTAHRADAGGAALVRRGKTTLAAARRLAGELSEGVLALQGPPGAGKTYTGARMICELVRVGKRVGVTAVSHKVIRNLLEEVVSAAADEGVEVGCVQKVSGRSFDHLGQPILEVSSNPAVAAALADGHVQVVGGTAWLWAREEFSEAVDVLFIDEAGQMSLANVLAVAQAAANIVLLGDPQQLEQPSRGSHPEGAEVSALEHLLDGAHTVADDRGLFLSETWRLHPAICSFTSELFYDSRLRSRPELAIQAIVGDTPFAGAGLWFCPVHHHGNQNSSSEEVERVASIFDALVSRGVTWTDRAGCDIPLSARDILVVAPYNAHVSAIADRLPSAARVGTVDRFQGQEAPVVIYSLATSSPEEAQRGMEFLYSLNRLNVATSRARCACILIANPLLFEPECRAPHQIRLANAFCRYLEFASVVE